MKRRRFDYGKKASNSPERGRRALRHLPRLVHLTFSAAPALTVGVVALRLTTAAVPVMQLWIAKLLLEVIESTLVGGGLPQWRQIVALLTAEFAVVVFGTGLGQVSGALEKLLGERVTVAATLRLMTHASTLDLASLETPAIQDQLQRADSHTRAQPALIGKTLGLLQSVTTLVSLVWATASVVPWLPVIVVGTTVPTALGQVYCSEAGYHLLRTWTQTQRILRYLRRILVAPSFAKEIKVFALGGFLIDRYARAHGEWYNAYRELARREVFVSIATTGMGSLGLYATYGIVVFLAVQNYGEHEGGLSLGAVVFVMGAVRQTRGVMQQVVGAVASLYEQSLHVQDYFGFLERRPLLRVGTRASRLHTPLRKGYRLENVTFRYAGASRDSLCAVNLEIRPGEAVAIVGRNGAGKTTLLRLLTRLYDPTEGQITLDGVDLHEYEPEGLRRGVAVLFQDFCRYEMTIGENIGVGNVGRLGDRQTIERAAMQSTAAAVIERFDRQYDQQLGSYFDDGVELSGGEWQRVGLARTFMTDAPIVILDEPTAALDGEGGRVVQGKIEDWRRERIVIMVSHRWSTLEAASRIVVLDQGRLVEDGTRDELLEQRGLFWRLLASRGNHR